MCNAGLSLLFLFDDRYCWISNNIGMKRIRIYHIDINFQVETVRYHLTQWTTIFVLHPPVRTDNSKYTVLS